MQSGSVFPAYAELSASAIAARGQRSVQHLSRSVHAGRTITIGRVILAAYWLVAFLLEPPDELRHPVVVSAILSIYATYSLLDLTLGWRLLNASRQSQIARHIGDMALFAVLMFMTQGSTSPFYLGLVFSLVCAALLFDLQAMQWTAATALLIYAAIAITTSGTPGFELSSVVVRAGFLGSMAALLIQLKIHEDRLKSDYRKLASWPREATLNFDAMAVELLQRVQAVLRVPRAMVVWEDAADSVVHIGTATAAGATVVQEPLQEFGGVVEKSARLRSFICSKWLRTPAARYESLSEGLQLLPSHPMPPSFRERFKIGHVVASRFTGETVSGWLLALDKDDLNEDDVVLTDIVAGLVESRLEQFYLAATVRDTAVAQERMRFARDLHDGVLQSLSGAALHLRSLRHFIQHDVDAALFSLAEVEQALATDQREVRSFITNLRATAVSDDDPRLASRLTTLGERIQREWGLKVTVETTPIIEMLEPGIAEEVYRIVKEALTNAAIHSNASRVRAEVITRSEGVGIVVEDNGHGFPFTGRYDLEALRNVSHCPLTLKERVTALGGELIIDSQRGGGARIEIDLPLSLVETAAV